MLVYLLLVTHSQLPHKSRNFAQHHAYDPYHPYDPYPHNELNQTSRSYSLVPTGDKSKHGMAGKDHVIQNFWYRSKSKIFRYLLPSSSLEEECIS